MTERRKKRRAITKAAQPGPSRAHALGFEQDLLQLADGLAEYSAINAFLCNSFTAALSAEEAAREEVIQGAKYFADFLQCRLQEIRYELDLVRERYRSDPTEAKLRK